MDLLWATANGLFILMVIFGITEWSNSSIVFIIGFLFVAVIASLAMKTWTDLLLGLGVFALLGLFSLFAFDSLVYVLLLSAYLILECYRFRKYMSKFKES